MGVVLLRTAHGLAQHGMCVAALNIHHHRLLVLVADHDTLEHALGHVSRPYPYACAWRRCSWSTVSMRAMVLRTTRMRPVFSSWPLARWKRRLNCSFFSLTSWSFSSSADLPRKSSAADAVFGALLPVFFAAIVFRPPRGRRTSSRS